MHILLACAAGMSTSILANNIMRLAEERNIDVTVDATSTNALNETQWRGADVVLVGPQMRHLLDQLAAQGVQYHVPVAAIPPQDYAMANAQSVLEQANTLVNNQQYHREAGQEFHPK